MIETNGEVIIFWKANNNQKFSLFLVLTQSISDVAVGLVCSEGSSKLILSASLLNTNCHGAPNIWDKHLIWSYSNKVNMLKWVIETMFGGEEKI